VTTRRAGTRQGLCGPDTVRCALVGPATARYGPDMVSIRTTLRSPGPGGSRVSFVAPEPPFDTALEPAVLALVRRVVDATVSRQRPEAADRGSMPPGLEVPAGAFVTITEGGELRSCMGRLDPDAPLWSNLLGAAAAAATDDPRFPSIQPAELPGLHLEVSVLGPLVELPDPAAFDPARHGIVIERGRKRGLLLPQVARERGWDARQTLEAVCWKAGLPNGEWAKPGTVLRVFTAVVFGEEGPIPASRTEAGDGAAPTG
jgi:AmmeMemoRadiSam system protein A